MHKKRKAVETANQNQCEVMKNNYQFVLLDGKKWYSKEEFRRRHQLSQFDFFCLKAMGSLQVTLDENGVEVFRWERRWK